MEFYFPTEFGEQLAFSAVATAALIGVLVMFAPGLTLKFFGLQPREFRPEGYGAARSAGGLTVGLFGDGPDAGAADRHSISPSARPWVSPRSDGSSRSCRTGEIRIRNFLLLVVQIILAALPLLYVYGLV